MSKNSLFQLKDTRNHVSRNGFDMSSKNAFTAKVGELLPVYWKQVLPGDKIKGSIQHFTRTQAVQTAAFTRIRENFSWYFVPYRLLWRFFPNVINSLQGQLNSSTSQISRPNLSTMLPQTTLSNLCDPKNSIIRTLAVQSSALDACGYDPSYKTAKLFNYLGYCYIPDSYVKALHGQTPATTTPPYKQDLKVSIFPLLAYQKIYQDFFRDSQWETLTPNAFNVDYITSDSTMVIEPHPWTVPTRPFYMNGMFTLRYANWRKDMLQGFLPSSQYGSVSLVDVNSDATGKLNIPSISFTGSVQGPNDKGAYVDAKFQNATGNSGSMLSPTDGTYFQAGNVVRTSGESSSKTVPFTAKLQGQFDILSLRKAQALQKLKEITQAHDLTIKGQTYAHWSVDVPDVLSQECLYLGGCDNNIDINEVVNTNLYGADNNGRATIAGKGTGSDTSFCFDFDAKEHGILMCIYHAVPLLDYESIGTDPQLVKVDASDYPTPEFDRLGLDVLPAYALQNTNETKLGWTANLGYCSRYIDFKTSLDKVSGGFLQGELQSWVAPVSRDYLNKFAVAGLDYRYFKVDPAILNPIFGVAADATIDSDNLLINSNFDVKFVRNLDFSGMPY